MGEGITMDKKNTIRFSSPRRGSALILVVVVTVLLAMVGIMFLMVSRVGDMMGAGTEQEYQLDQAVQAVTARIERLLMEDLFGKNLTSGIVDKKGGSNEPYDAPDTADPWLASLEPVLEDPGDPADPTDDLFRWPYISNILTSTPNYGGVVWDRRLGENAIIPEYQKASDIHPGNPADADGDGVADSVWMPFPNQTAGGEQIYAAVRIIDNCAMLNLNTAYTFYQDSRTPDTNPSSFFNRPCYLNRTATQFPYTRAGRYLSEVNALPFLRGADLWFRDPGPLDRRWYNLMKAKRAYDFTNDLPMRPFEYDETIIENIENPGSNYSLFDINDELEIRNRFLLTSLAEARFESVAVANYTFDAGGGLYGVKRIPYADNNEGGIPELARWKWHMDPRNFDHTSGAFEGSWKGQNLDNRFYYGRRHVCTFYSFDRNLRWGGDPVPASWTAEEREQYLEIYKKIFMPGEGHAVSVRADILSNTPQARRNILHLLYAFRAYFYNQGAALREAARRSAQLVANMIDYLDDSEPGAQTGPFAPGLYGAQYNQKPTYITRQIINRMIAETTAYLYNSVDSSVPFYPESAIPAAFEFGLDSKDVVYGFERQPFISELYVLRDNNNNTVEVALELLNPYDSEISLANWRILFNRIRASTPFTIPSTTVIRAGSSVTPSRLVIQSNNSSVPVTGTSVTLTGFGLNTLLADANSIDLQRPDPSDPNPASPTMFITVDRIPKSQILLMLTDNPADGQPTIHSLKRQDTGWKFTNAGAFVHQQAVPPAASPARLGTANEITVNQPGWQMPVADFHPISEDRRFFTLGDFQKVLFIGNQGGNDPNTVTTAVAEAADEGDIRFDIVKNPELLGYICFLNRENGSLPGRININTAPKYVLAAAIPSILTHSSGTVNLIDPDTSTPQIVEEYADLIIKNRPYRNIGDLLKISAFKEYAEMDGLDMIGDQSIKGDIEERDLILSHLSNIFTTRSDAFTAYILVRLGPSGPQRRVMAIFDRSQVWGPEDRPRIVALKTVPNPR